VRFGGLILCVYANGALVGIYVYLLQDFGTANKELWPFVSRMFG